MDSETLQAIKDMNALSSNRNLILLLMPLVQGAIAFVVLVLAWQVTINDQHKN